MKQKILITFFISLSLLNCVFALNNKSNELQFFYVPDQKEINRYIKLLRYLTNWEKEKVNVDEKQLEDFYSTLVSDKSLPGLLFESFLRQTKNEHVKKHVLHYIQVQKLNDPFSRALVRLYNSQKKIIKNEEHTQVQFVFEGEGTYFDENIDLFNQTQSYVFDRELGVMLFQNNWSQLTFTMEGSKKNRSEDSFNLLYGGGTNFLRIHFGRRSKISFRQFYSEVISRCYTNSKINLNWKIQELEKEGILARSGADKIFIGFNVLESNNPGITDAYFNIYLYNEELQKGYSVSYSMNFSIINNNFNSRFRIWNQLLMHLNMTFLNVKT